MITQHTAAAALGLVFRVVCLTLMYGSLRADPVSFTFGAIRSSIVNWRYLNWYDEQRGDDLRNSRAFITLGSESPKKYHPDNISEYKLI